MGNLVNWSVGSTFERNRKWDRQIEEDPQSGKLRALYERLQSENQGQSNLPRDEFLDHEKLS